MHAARERGEKKVTLDLRFIYIERKVMTLTGVVLLLEWVEFKLVINFFSIATKVSRHMSAVMTKYIILLSCSNTPVHL